MPSPSSHRELWRPATAALGLASAMVVLGRADAQVEPAKPAGPAHAGTVSVQPGFAQPRHAFTDVERLRPGAQRMPLGHSAPKDARVVRTEGALAPHSSSELPTPQFAQGPATLALAMPMTDADAADRVTKAQSEPDITLMASSVDFVAPPAPAVSAAYIEQIGGLGTVDARLASARASASEPNLAEQIAAMQVPTAVGIGAEERAAMLATAPEQLSVRLGNAVLGKVAVRGEMDGAVTVQLSGLLDLLKDRFEPDEFEQLRSAAQADAFVPVTRIADSGIAVEYNAAYDELTIG